ncbi:MAG TPA: IclR family transcriptional regulator [Pseudonocardia sp.]|nr:IclR family transcriptional regulator [Pseudonocardia sp.]
MKNKPAYAITSVDHALQLATVLQVEGPLTVSEAAERLGVARSTAHRLLSMLSYRDFAVQDGDRRYSAGPVLSLAARTHSRAALLRAVAMPHLVVLAGRVAESTNLQVLAGDHVRFIGSVEGSQALRVGNREGMVFPAHRTSGGVLLLADLPSEQFDAIYSDERWADRTEQRPDLKALRREMRLARDRGFAINNGRTETGVTAVGRAVRAAGGRAEATVSISLPTARYSRTVLPQLVAALAVTTADIERELAASEQG